MMATKKMTTKKRARLFRWTAQHRRRDDPYSPMRHVIVTRHPRWPHSVMLATDGSALAVAPACGLRRGVYDARRTIQSGLDHTRFPDYAGIIPRDFPYQIEVDTARFSDAIHRAHVIARERNFMVCITAESRVGQIETALPCTPTRESRAVGSAGHTSWISSSRLIQALSGWTTRKRRYAKRRPAPPPSGGAFPCRTCGGTGALSRCAQCNGRGRTQLTGQCPSCDGSGRYTGRCWLCTAGQRAWMSGHTKTPAARIIIHERSAGLSQTTTLRFADPHQPVWIEPTERAPTLPYGVLIMPMHVGDSPAAPSPAATTSTSRPARAPIITIPVCDAYPQIPARVPTPTEYDTINDAKKRRQIQIMKTTKQDYQKAIAQAKADYEEAMAQAEADYRKAIAQAEADYEEDDEEYDEEYDDFRMLTGAREASQYIGECLANYTLDDWDAWADGHAWADDIIAFVESEGIGPLPVTRDQLATFWDAEIEEQTAHDA